MIKMAYGSRLTARFAYGLILFLAVSCQPLAVCYCAEPLENTELSAKIEDAIRQYVVSKNPLWVDSKIKVTYNMNNQISERLASYGDAVSFCVPEIYANSGITPSIILPLQVLENNVEKERIFIQVYLKIIKPVAVTNRALKKDYAFQATNLELQERDILKVRENYFSSVDLLIGKQTKGFIPAGVVIVGTMVKDIPTIGKNQGVKILVEGEGIRVETVGIALQDGMVGEKIKVKRENCRETIDTKVVSPGMVEVQL